VKLERPAKRTMIRGTHPDHFRSGEWAEIVGVGLFERTHRICYVVVFPDGETDEWPVIDFTAGYELAPAVLHDALTVTRKV
jgi:hypothetical protein